MRPRSTRLFALAALTALVLGLGRSAPSIALNDPEYAQQWGMQRIGAKAAWDAGLFGEGVDIAIVDSGVHLTHQDLAPNVIGGYDFVNDDNRPQDDNEHGTHVAGIAAAVIDNGGVVGVAPKARIMPVKVLDENFATVGSDVGAGIRWAVDHGAEVINLSLGNLGQSVFGPSTQDAVAYAWSKGVICVFAAGNDYVMPSGFRDENAIVVVSTGRDDERSSFSNRVGEAKWGLAAPGSQIFSTIWVADDRTDTYASLSGTSMAAPHVAGAAALLRAAGLSPQQTVDRLLSTAKDLGSSGPDTQFGYGRLDVAKAVAGLSGGSSTTAPATTAAPTPTTSGSPTSAPAPPATTRTTARQRPSTTAPPGATPAPTDTAAPPAAPAPETTPVAPVDVLEPPDGGSGALDAAAPRPSGRLEPPEDARRTPVALIGLASLAALGTAGWASWLAWRRRAEPAR